jgi:coenzyme PQQ precursor peptide PqqA
MKATLTGRIDRSHREKLEAISAKFQGAESIGKMIRNCCRSNQQEDSGMAWIAPLIVEICVGMEVTSYASAEI